jgi:hypothetical protein
MILALAGCNGPAPTAGGNGQTNHIRAIVAIDYNHPWTLAAVDFRRNAARRPDADITFDTDALVFARTLFPIDSVFSIATSSATTYAAGEHKWRISDSTVFRDSLNTIVPAAFDITSINPSNRLMQGLGQANLQWSGANGAETYVIAAVLRQSAYTGIGYSAYASSFNTAGTFPPEAFSLSPGPAADTGWYYLYVYAVTGSPDSAYSRHLLPVPLPSQLTDNVSETHFGGNHGTVVITERDSLHVVQQL